MTYADYNTAIAALEAPEDLTIFERLAWYKTEIEKLRDKLTAKDLRRVQQDQKNWNAKVSSSLQD